MTYCMSSKTASLSNSKTLVRAFRYIMLKGKVQSTLRYLSRNTNRGVLKMENLVYETMQNAESILCSSRDILKQKQAMGNNPDNQSVLEIMMPNQPTPSY